MNILVTRAVVVFVALVAVAGFMPVSLCYAGDFYCDPVNGTSGGDGSMASPWGSFASILSSGKIESHDQYGSVINSGAPVQPGDTIYLLDGYHGDVQLRNYYNDELITVMAADGHTARFRRIAVTGARNWIFKGLDISPSNAATYDPITSFSVSGYDSVTPENETKWITIEDCFIYSMLDSSTWTVADWLANVNNCISFARTTRECTARNNYMLNLGFGITLAGPDSLAEGNEIENFRGDGMRVLNSGVHVINNTIRNCYNVDGNHDDGIQSYRTNTGLSSIDDVVIRGNTIINQTDPNQPHPGTLQGIGCFDGPFYNWVVEDNLVLVDHWHGITLDGCHNCLIQNNTVVNPFGSMTAWIQFMGGVFDSTARNNITREIDRGEATTILENNLDLDDYDWADIFVDWENGDFHLKAGSPAIDAGSNTALSEFDIEGNYRLMGLSADIGAYEFASVHADAGEDIVVDDSLGDSTETVTLDASASTTVPGAAITFYKWEEDGAVIGFGETLDVDLSVGEHAIDLTVQDDAGNVGMDQVAVTVNPILHAAAGDDQVVYDSDGDGFESVTLDGSASSSSLGNVTFYVWYEDGAMVGAGAVKTIDASVGTHVYTLQVRDSLSNVATDEVEITVSADSPLTPGDANGDGFVNLDDFIILKQNYGTTGAAWAQGDFNDDGAVNLDDFILLKQNYGL